MKRILYISAMLSSLLMSLLSCTPSPAQQDTPGKKEEDKPVRADDPQHSVFRLGGKLFSSVHVTVDDANLFDYAFTYDEWNRVKSFKFSSAGTVLQDLSVEVVDTVRETVSGMNSGKRTSIQVKWVSSALVWSHDNLENSNRYVLSCDELSSMPKRFYYNTSFNGGKFTNNCLNSEVFTADGGNVAGAIFTSHTESTGSKGLVSVSDETLSRTISYTTHEDVSNLGALFLGEDFFLWYMKGLPGNKYLISEIETLGSNSATPRRSKFSYTFNISDGSVKTATVENYFGETLQHTYVYTFKY